VRPKLPWLLTSKCELCMPWITLNFLWLLFVSYTPGRDRQPANAIYWPRNINFYIFSGSSVAVCGRILPASLKTVFPLSVIYGTLGDWAKCGQVTLACDLFNSKWHNQLYLSWKVAKYNTPRIHTDTVVPLAGCIQLSPRSTKLKVGHKRTKQVPCAANLAPQRGFWTKVNNHD